MILAPPPRRLAAQDFALAGLFQFVSHVLIRSGRPLTPPFRFSSATRTFAAARAGPSNGAIAPVLSCAQPITIGAAAVVVLPPSPAPNVIAPTAATAIASAPNRFRPLIPASFWLPGP